MVNFVHCFGNCPKHAPNADARTTKRGEILFMHSILPTPSDYASRGSTLSTSVTAHLHAVQPEAFRLEDSSVEISLSEFLPLALSFFNQCSCRGAACCSYSSVRPSHSPSAEPSPAPRPSPPSPPKPTPSSKDASSIPSSSP